MLLSEHEFSPQVKTAGVLLLLIGAGCLFYFFSKSERTPEEETQAIAASTLKAVVWWRGTDGRTGYRIRVKSNGAEIESYDFLYWYERSFIQRNGYLPGTDSARHALLPAQAMVGDSLIKQPNTTTLLLKRGSRVLFFEYINPYRPVVNLSSL
jgi:hypothetical protein